MDFFLSCMRVVGTAFFLFTGFAVAAPIVYFAYASITKTNPPYVARAGRLNNVHSLAVNPRDGTLFAGTSRGVFWIRDSRTAERVNSSYQSTRGPIATGPDALLGSGSPDLRDIVGGWEPRFAGLIESRNAGKSWRTVSLKGEADFHTLELRDGALYGYDYVSQSFMVSGDRGKTWETRSQLEPLLDFAINPANVSLILAAAEERLLLSRDGGSTWQPRDGPRLQHLAWPGADSFWAVDDASNTYLSADAGETWEQREPLPGAAQAFVATIGAVYAGVRTDDGVIVYSSSDGARSWQVHYRDPIQASASPEPSLETE